MTLLKYVLKRVAIFIPTILVIIILNFLIIHSAPGDPVMMYLGESSPSPELIARLRADFGLDKPLHEQLFIYISMVFRGNLGYSFIRQKPILQVILERLPATVLLTSSAFVTFSLLGVAFGVISAKRQYSFVDNTIVVVSLAMFSTPVFWLAQVLLLTFSANLGLFPVGGMTSLRAGYTGIRYALDVSHHLVLPAAVCGASQFAMITRMTRSSMIETFRKDFVTTARCKGLSEWTITIRHVLRNALLPVVTLIGNNFGFLLAGAVLTETVFAWPGMGRLMYEGVVMRDYPLLLGGLIFISMMILLANLVTDILYAFVDPRVRHTDI